MGNAEALAALKATIPAAQPTTSATAPVVQTPEAAAAAPTEPTKSADLESTRFAHLAKKEAELQRQREAFKREQTQFMSERQKNQAIQDQLNQFNTMKVKDPVAALKLIGFSEKDLFNFIAAQEDKRTPEEKARAAAQDEIKKFTDSQAADLAKQQEEKNREVLGNFRQSIKATIASDKDKYEFCNFHGPLAEDLIYETTKAVLIEDLKADPNAKPISLQEAADMVEQFYEEQDKEMNTLKKRQGKPVEPQAPVKEEPLKPQVSPRPSAPRPTLSNKTGATVASTISKPANETPDQKKARLIGKYFGQPQ